MRKALNNNTNIKWLHITDITQLKSYEDLWESCLNYTAEPFFSSPHWINNWIKTFWTHSNVLHLYIALDDEKCVLFAPFYIQHQTSFPFIKKLTLLGQGELEIFEVSSEYQDILLSPDYQHLLPDLARKLSSLNFDHVKISALIENASILAVFSYLKSTAINQSGIRYSYLPAETSSPKLSKNNKSKLNKCINKLNSLNAKYIWVKEEDYSNYWEVMKEFHQLRWKNKNKKGAFFHNKFSQFHNNLIKENPQNIKISAVIVNNSPIAINYYYYSNNALYFYQSGWDEVNYSQVSPGFSLHIWSMKNCHGALYDFMMGNSKNSYKAKLGCNDNNKMYNILLVKSKLKILFAKLMNKFKNMNKGAE